MTIQVKDFINGYVVKLKNLLDQIDLDELEKFINLIEGTRDSRARIFILGNGGSAATASHMVNDLGAGLRRRNIRNFDIHSLADNVPVVTALANDIGYENIFEMQMRGLIAADDVVVAISCSGESPNIINAVNYAKEVGCSVVGITGFDGGKLRCISDVNLHVDAPKGEYGLVEDVHMIFDHIIYSYYISEMAR
jgi:D-sedoheptulose 7-phosphate isomerase